MSKQLHALVLHEDGQWVVVCLEHCISGSGESFHQAYERFVTGFIGQASLDKFMGNEPLANTPPAPQEFRSAWEHARTKMSPPPPSQSAISGADPSTIAAIEHTEFATI